MFVLWTPHVSSENVSVQIPEKELTVQTIKATSENQKDLKQNLKSLDQKVDILEKINSKVLDTIYFSLGGIGGLVLAIIGLNFFQNYSLNQKNSNHLKVILRAIRSLVTKD